MDISDHLNAQYVIALVCLYLLNLSYYIVAYSPTDRHVQTVVSPSAVCRRSAAFLYNTKEFLKHFMLHLRGNKLKSDDLQLHRVIHGGRFFSDRFCFSLPSPVSAECQCRSLMPVLQYCKGTSTHDGYDDVKYNNLFYCTNNKKFRLPSYLVPRHNSFLSPTPQHNLEADATGDVL